MRRKKKGKGEGGVIKRQACFCIFAVSLLFPVLRGAQSITESGEEAERRVRRRAEAASIRQKERSSNANSSKHKQWLTTQQINSTLTVFAIIIQTKTNKSDSPAQQKEGWQWWKGLHHINICCSHNIPNISLQNGEGKKNAWDRSNFLWSTSVLEVFMTALRVEFISQSHATAYNTATGFDPWPLKVPLATEIKRPAWWVNEWNRPCVVDGWTEGKRVGEKSHHQQEVTGLQRLQWSRFTISFVIAFSPS